METWNMRPYWMIAVLIAAALGASGGRAAAAEMNKPPEGYIALFNGKDLSNWQGLVDIKARAALKPEELKARQEAADQKMRESWSVKDGVLIFSGKGDSLQTVKDYGNFELYVDWKILKGGDSGIYLRGNPQVQIWDNPIGSGGLYNNKAPNRSTPLVVADKPVGEWNTFWIRMVGDRVTVKLNDKLVVDNVPLDNYWFPGQPLPAKGPIELQNHGNILEFRNIYLKELPDDAAAVPSLLNLELTKVPLARVIQMLAASGNLEIILKDPEGKLTQLPISLTIRQRSLEKAIALVCSAGGLEFIKDSSGVYYLSAKQ